MTATISARELSVMPVDGGYALVAGGNVIRTAFGKALAHPSEAIMQHLLSELVERGEVTITDDEITAPRFFGFTALITIMRDYLEVDNDDLSLAFEQCVLSDPILYAVPGPEQAMREAEYGPVRDFLGGDFAFLRNYVTHIENQAFEPVPTPVDAKIHAQAKRMIKRIERMYRALSIEERTVVMYLYALHNNSVLLAMALVLNRRCTTAAYAAGVLASQMLNHEVFADVKKSESRKAFQGFECDAEVAMRFLQMARRHAEVR